ncbi:hypothetical protein QQP08_011605 [Theobroma cacao]|nr:hypothetical protein QQP08_011605 [Theobroma cacao]
MSFTSDAGFASFGGYRAWRLSTWIILSYREAPFSNHLARQRDKIPKLKEKANLLILSMNEIIYLGPGGRQSTVLAPSPRKKTSTETRTSLVQKI